MKFKNRLFPIFIIALIFNTGCSDFLTETPESFLTEDVLFSTEDGLETAVNGLYATLSAPNYYGSDWHTVIYPVSGKFFSTQKANRDATSLNAASNNTFITRIWAQAYETINVANIIIQNQESNGNLPNSQKALGHAHFARGLAYFDLVRLFGAVPIRLTPSTKDDLHVGRANRAEVYDLVIAELESAKELLPETGTSINFRPSKLVANVYLAKLYMTLAGEDGGNVALWANAQQELLPVINSGKYQLTPTYSELFQLENENNVESIYELQYGHTGGIRNSDIVRSFTPSNSTFNDPSLPTFGRIRPNKEVFDAHLSQYPDDPRIAATFIWERYEKNDGKFQNIYPKKSNGNQGFPLIRKWLDPTYNGTTTARNIIMLRYADALLMMAEIENEINGPDAAYQYVNQVLARARDIDGDGVSDAEQPADWSGLDQATFRNRILLERSFELLSEGQDWFDTRRRGYQFFLDNVVIPHNTNPTFDNTTDFMYPEDRKNMLLPIPLAEISGNQAITSSDQNPGY